MWMLEDEIEASLGLHAIGEPIDRTCSLHRCIGHRTQEETIAVHEALDAEAERARAEAAS